MQFLSILGLFLVVGWPVSLETQDSAKAKSEARKVTPEEAAQENPVQPNEENLEEGKVLFDSQCAMCHGKTGDGKGDLAQSLNLKIPNLSSPDTLREISDGALFVRITKGKGSCPEQEDRLPAPMKWKLINYIHKLSGGGTIQTKSAKGDKAESTTAPAPSETKPEEKAGGGTADQP